MTGQNWICEDCGWQWPLAEWNQEAECDACGGEMRRSEPISRESAEGITGIYWDNLGSGGES